jgi:hypothetical protein
MGHIYSSQRAETIECATCRRECDPLDEEMSKLNGYNLCPECRELCAGDCGEYLTDETVAIGGPIVHYRDYIYDGKLVHAHASCAALTLLGYIDRDLDDWSTREQIAHAVACTHEMAVAL